MAIKILLRTITILMIKKAGFLFIFISLGYSFDKINQFKKVQNTFKVQVIQANILKTKYI
jgi:hypothetical protein